MRAAVVHEFGEPGVMKVLEMANLLGRTGPGGGQVQLRPQVLIAVKAAGVNPVDTYIRSGAYARKPTLPYIPGKDGAGQIVEVGPEVDGVAVGDRVWVTSSVTGTYASHCIAEASGVHRLPDNISFPQGASLYVPYATAFRALVQKGRAKAGDTVLVHGASGGVGIAACQFARAMGCHVIGTASSAAGRELVEKEGAHSVYNHREKGYMEAIKASTGAKEGVDIILEMLANVNLCNDLQTLCKNGRVVVVGNRGTIDINPRDLMARESSVCGVALAHSTVEDTQEQVAAITAGLESGSLRPVVGKTYELDEVAQSHVDVIENSGALGKLILIP